MHLALFIHRHMPHNRGRGGRCARLCRALGESHSQDAPQLRPASPPLAGRASGWFTSLIHQRSSLHLLISSGVTSQVREGPSAGPRLNSPHLLFLSRKTQPLSLSRIVRSGGASDALGVRISFNEQAPVHRGPAFKQDHHLDHGDNGKRILLHNLCPYTPSARKFAPILRSETSDRWPSRSAKVRSLRSISRAAAWSVACRRSSAHEPTSRPASLTMMRSPR